MVRAQVRHAQTAPGLRPSKSLRESLPPNEFRMGARIPLSPNSRALHWLPLARPAFDQPPPLILSPFHPR
jgi:hypothetical protein